MNTLPHAHGGPPLRGILRATAEDFVVEEILGYEADGDGEHVLVLIEKRDTNTQWLANELARFAGVSQKNVGYAGLKDRHAVTRQSFSVHLAGRDAPDWSAFPHPEVRVLAHARHRRKLKRGALRGNRFDLTLRDLDGDSERAVQVLDAIRTHGVPNYFGEQRFGHGGANIERARRMFAGHRVDKATRSLLLSAARSELFNAVLARRVLAGTWNRPVQGEIWCLDGSHSWFGPEPLDAALEARVATGDIHPSGPMWGRGELPGEGDAAELERQVIAARPELAAGLEAAGLGQDRRALRLRVRDLQWQWSAADILRLQFTLPAGAYATVVVRELMAVD